MITRNEIKMNEIKYKPIGIIHSPFKIPKGTPIQPTAARDLDGTIKIFHEYVEGLDDLEGFSHIILIYNFHLAKKSSLKVKPYMDDKMHGVFATRSPSRPNSIGISIVRLVRINGNIFYIKDVDILDGTPLLDIKPYVPDFDIRKTDKIGWLERRIHKISITKDDGRFTNVDGGK